MTQSELPTKNYQNSIKIDSKIIDSESTKNSDLILEVGFHRFRIGVLENGTFTHFEDYRLESYQSTNHVLESLNTIYENHPFLNLQEWKSVAVVVYSDTFTHLPSSLFRKEYTSQYLKLAKGKELTSTEKAISFEHKTLEIYSLFLVPMQWCDFFQDSYPLQTIRFIHSTSQLLQTKNTAGYKMAINFEESHFVITLWHDSQLLLCNRFKFANTEEALFFVLACLQKHTIEGDQISTILYGEITPFSDIYKELAKYIDTIQFGCKPSNTKYHPDFSDLPNHRYYTILNVNQSI